MNETPVQVTRLSESTMPLLVWFTLLLVFVFSVFLIFSLVVHLLTVPTLIARGASLWQIAAVLAIQILLVSALVALFFGLVKRRHWAWPSSIVFATMVLALFFVSRIWPVNGPLPILSIAPEQMLGAAIGEIVITILIVLYPLRLYFSRKVRAFFGVLA